MTSDRVKAIIKQGIKKQITVPATANNPASQAFIDVVLELNVTPHITQNGEVIMELLVKKDDNITGSADFANREIQTKVKVKDGETVVLGGAMRKNQIKTIIGYLTYQVFLFLEIFLKRMWIVQLKRNYSSLLPQRL